MRRSFNLGSLTLAALLVGSAVFAQSASPRASAPDTKALLEDMRLEVQTLGQLMFTLGACRDHLDKGELNPHADLFSVTGQTDQRELVQRCRDILTQLYLMGREQAAEPRYDVARCQRQLDDTAASVLTARRNRKYR